MGTTSLITRRPADCVTNKDWLHGGYYRKWVCSVLIIHWVRIMNAYACIVPLCNGNYESYWSGSTAK